MFRVLLVRPHCYFIAECAILGDCAQLKTPSPGSKDRTWRMTGKVDAAKVAVIDTLTDPHPVLGTTFPSRRHYVWGMLWLFGVPNEVSTECEGGVDGSCHRASVGAVVY